MAIGLGIPREPLRLVGAPAAPRAGASAMVDLVDLGTSRARALAAFRNLPSAAPEPPP